MSGIATTSSDSATDQIQGLDLDQALAAEGVWKGTVAFRRIAIA